MEPFWSCPPQRRKRSNLYEEVSRQHSPHPNLIHLRTTLRPDAKTWLDGGNASEQLIFFIAKLRWAIGSDRPGEPLLAQLHKRALGKSCHSEAYQSFGLRLANITDLIDSPSGLATRAISLERHPVLCQLRPHAKTKHWSINKQRGKVISHVDWYSLYSMVRAIVDFVDDKRG